MSVRAGGRTSDTIVAWLKKKTGPPAVALADLDAAKEFIGEKSIVVIGLFADETTAEAKGFLEAARNGRFQILNGRWMVLLVFCVCKYALGSLIVILVLTQDVAS